MSYIGCDEIIEVPYSGSVRVSDGNGGSSTVSYSGTTTARIIIHVNTNPFDRSVSDTCNNANLLTGAVVGMQGAQVAQIQDSAQRVSDSLVRGFYSLMSKDITEQKAEALNKLNAKFALLKTTSEALQDKMDRMDSDIARLQNHYTGIFTGLDEDLKKRISQLDGKAFVLSGQIRDELLMQPFKTDGAFGFEQSCNQEKTDNLLTTARIRKKVSDVLNNIADYTEKCVDYKADVSSMMDTVPADEPVREYIPTVISLQRNLQERRLEYRCAAPEMPSQQQVTAGVEQFAYHTTEAAWSKPSEMELTQIDRAFSQYVNEASQADGADPNRTRVYQQMMALWNHNRDNMKSV